MVHPTNCEEIFGSDIELVGLTLKRNKKYEFRPHLNFLIISRNFISLYLPNMSLWCSGSVRYSELSGLGFASRKAPTALQIRAVKMCRLTVGVTSSQLVH